MKKTISIFSILILLSPGLVFAHGEEIFEEAEELIESKIPCDQLTDDQLEIIGDYYMEQMHPGEAHEVMDEMMGGEGSPSLRQVHINMARSFYCGERGAMSSGMMDMMMGRGAGGSLGMMNGVGGGMLPFGFSGMGSGSVLIILFWILIIGFVVWIITQYIRSGQGGKMESAMETARRRYANGEITKNQFEDIKRELSKKHESS